MTNFLYCPRCGTPLEQTWEDGRARPHCPTCGFVHYHNPAPAAGAVIFKTGALLMVQRAHAPYVGDWVIPAGFCEWDEHPADTAVRELAEETGLQIRISGLFNVYSGHDDPRTNAILMLYFAEIVGGALKPSDDALDARFFSRRQLPPNIAFAAHRQALADLQSQYSERFGTDAD